MGRKRRAGVVNLGGVVRLAPTIAQTRVKARVVLVFEAVLFSSFVRFTADTFRERISEGLPGTPTPPSRHGNLSSGVGVDGDPAVIDLSGLFLITDDEQFLREAYQRVLGRECDPLGFIHFREMLRSHAPRQVVLSHLIGSDEARQLGRRFTGLPDSKLQPRHWTYRGRALWLQLQRAVINRVRALLHVVLQATRIEHLEHKVDYLLQELATRSDRISTKADQSLWTLSEKLDAYTGTVLQKQSYLQADIAGQYRQIDDAARSLRQGMDANGLEAREHWRELASSVDVLFQRTDVMNDALANALPDAIASATGAVEEKIRLVEDKIGLVEDKIRSVDDRIGSVDNRIGSVDNWIGSVDNRIGSVDQKILTTEETIRHSAEASAATFRETHERMAKLETGTSATQSAVSRLSAGLAQQAEALQQVREELTTATEAQNRSNHQLKEMVTNRLATAAEAQSRSNDLLSEKVASQLASATEAQKQSNDSLSETLTNRVATALEAQNQSNDRLSEMVTNRVATALEAQNQSNERLNEMVGGRVDSISRASAESVASLSSDLASLSTNLNERLAQILERQSAIELQQSSIELQQTELRKELETPRPKPPMVFQGGENVLVSELDGFIVGVPGEEWRMAAYHAFRGPMEPGLLRAFQRVVKPGMVVVDVGANIGIFTLYGARLVGWHGKVFSFEPAPRVFQILRDNVQVNGLLESGVIEFRQMAAWDRAGVAKMTVYDADSGHSTLFPSDRPGREIEVTTCALDKALSGQKRVDVVKIDAEGAEPKILHGMRRIIERNQEIVVFIEFAPVHLRRAGVEPIAFLDEIASMGLSIQQVDDVTGDLRTVDREQLAACFSANLSLSRMAA